MLAHPTMSADEDNKTDAGGDCHKSFQGIQFAQVEDAFDVSVQYDGSSESLSICLRNQTTQTLFKTEFDSERIAEITQKYQLEPPLLARMIVDTLSSKQRTASNMRICIMPNMKRGIRT